MYPPLEVSVQASIQWGDPVIHNIMWKGPINSGLGYLN